MPPSLTVHIIAQSHIDLAWLWDWEETVNVCCPLTFGPATENLAKFPQYRFSQSQVPLYTATRDHHPALYAKIRQYMNEGRWEIVGVMYVETEGAQPCGESLVRQCVWGKRFWREAYGIDVTTGWQEDAWTHPWQLAQILAKCGVNAYFFKRGVKHDNYFWWEGPDGSRVLCVKPLHSLWHYPNRHWGKYIKEMRQKYGLNHIMIRIGKGDHGGGPTAREIAKVLKYAKKHAKKMTVTFETFRSYMDRLLESKPMLPTLKEELGFELVGDLTNCGAIKQANRDCENLLLDAEKWASIAKVLLNKPYPWEELTAAWERVLFNQFHDIIGGSAIPSVNTTALQEYDRIRRTIQPEIRTACEQLAGTPHTELDLAVGNSLSWVRTDVITIPLPKNDGKPWTALQDAAGNYIPIQLIAADDGKDHMAICEVPAIPGIGLVYFRFTYMNNTPELIQTGCRASIEPTGSYLLENRHYRLELSPSTGNFRVLFDKTLGRNLIPDGMEANALLAIEDEGDSEGRLKKGDDYLAIFPGKVQNISLAAETDSIRITEAGPVRATVEIHKRYQNSTFIHTISLYAHQRRIDCSVTIDWHDVHRVIKVAFPIAIQLENSPVLTYDSAYGTVHRPLDLKECPAQKWADITGGTSSDRFGVAILNTGRYAYDTRVERGYITLRLTLLRSPTSPAVNHDHGIHRISYSLVPHRGSWEEGRIMQHGYEVNFPLVVIQQTGSSDMNRSPPPPPVTYFGVDAANVILESIFEAYDRNGFICRMFEFQGQRTSVTLRAPRMIIKAEETDLLEEPMMPLQPEGNHIHFEISPFEIKTLRIVLQ
jgi:alpha-mannosidase